MSNDLVLVSLLDFWMGTCDVPSDHQAARTLDVEPAKYTAFLEGEATLKDLPITFIRSMHGVVLPEVKEAVIDILRHIDRFYEEF